VLAKQHRPRAPYEAAQHERDEDRVVELARDGDEVGHQVERHGEIDEREPGRELPPGRHPRIGEQPLEQHGAVRHEPGDHPDVPLPRARGERRQEGGIHRDQHGDHDE
jgi:hypothetical protein